MWPFRKSPPVETQIQIIPRDRSALRLSEFRADAGMANRARAILADGFTRLMLDVLDNEHPAYIVLHDNSSIEARAVYQARCEGYTMALANLEALAVENKTVEPLIATFEEQTQTQ